MHLSRPLPLRSLITVPVDIADSISITHVRVSDLPANWRATSPPPELADIGTRWAEGRKSAVLAVPSAVIPQEVNYLLNPSQPAFERIRIGRPEPFFFDPRVWKW